MLPECPHCFRRVIPYDDGRCPSCQKNLNDKPKSQAEKTRIVVDESMTFPKICCTCGTATGHYTKISHSGEVATDVGMRRAGSRESSASFQVLMFLIAGWISRLYFFHSNGASNRADSTIAVNIPQCKTCRKAAPIKPESVDLEHHRIAFVVHRQFAEAM